MTLLGYLRGALASKLDTHQYREEDYTPKDFRVEMDPEADYDTVQVKLYAGPLRIGRLGVHQ